MSSKKREPASPESPSKKQKSDQASLNSFFASPKPKKRAKQEQIEQDAKLARKLSNKLNKAANGTFTTVKEDGVLSLLSEDEEDEDDDLIILDQSTPVASTSKTTLDNVKSESMDQKPFLKEDVKPQLRMMATFDMKGKGIAQLPDDGGPPVESKSLDTPVCAFNPLLDVDTSKWPKGRMPFSYLTEAFVSIGSTKSRLAIMRIMTNLLRVVIEHDPESLLSVIYLTTNRLGPAQESDNELGIGHQVLTKAIKEVSGITPQALRSLWNKYGDAGDIAFEANKNVRLLVPPAPLACHSLYATLVKLSKLRGHGVLNQKTDIVKKLLIAAKGEEIRYVTRILVQHIRIGAVRLTLTTALARAFCLSRPTGCPIDDYYMTEEERDRYLKIEMSKLGKGKASTPKVKDVDDIMKDAETKLLAAEILVRKVWARHPNYARICDALLSGGLTNLDERVPLTVGTPVQPMLGSITRSLDSVYTRLQNRPFAAEAKLDGQRAQIHVSLEGPKEGEGGKGRWYDPPADLEGRRRIWVRVFSRHLEDMTEKYPDMFGTLASIVARSQSMEETLTSFMIDSEIVAIDPVTGAFRTFQELSYRSRKDVELGNIKIRVGIFAFDLMLLNGKSLLSEPFRRRRDLLRRYFGPCRPEDPKLAKWELIPSCDENDIETVRTFFAKSLDMKAEGIMVKLLDELEIEVAEPEAVDESPTKGKGKGTSRRKVIPASYEPDKRADSWLKVKKDYLDDLGDSLDLVPIGAWHGMGRKASWWSPILLACYDEETGTYVATCKIISGMTDAFYKDLNVRYAEGNENTSYVKPPEVDAGRVSPAIWFKPKEVWEIRGADFTASPVYPSNFSVRFPRFIRIREDKGVEQATTMEQLADMYRAQGEPSKAVAGEEEEEEEQEAQDNAMQEAAASELDEAQTVDSQ